MEMIPEKPTPRCAAQSTIPVAMAPDREISARFPAPGVCAEKLAVRGTFGGFCQRIRAAAKPGGDNESACSAQVPCLIDDVRDCSCRRSDHHEFRHKGHSAEVADRGNAGDLGIVRIHLSEFAFEFRIENILKDGPPNRSPPWGSPRPARPNGAKAGFSNDRSTSVQWVPADTGRILV